MTFDIIPRLNEAWQNTAVSVREQLLKHIGLAPAMATTHYRNLPQQSRPLLFRALAGNHFCFQQLIGSASSE